jgi:hypothetical protein
MRVLMQQGMIVATLVTVAIWSWYHPPDASIAPWSLWLGCGITMLIALVCLPELTHTYRNKRPK